MLSRATVDPGAWRLRQPQEFAFLIHSMCPPTVLHKKRLPLPSQRLSTPQSPIFSHHHRLPQCICRALVTTFTPGKHYYDYQNGQYSSQCSSPHYHQMPIYPSGRRPHTGNWCLLSSPDGIKWSVLVNLRMILFLGSTNLDSKCSFWVFQTVARLHFKSR